MDIKFISTAVVKRAIPVIFLCGGMLVANMAHAGWLARFLCSGDNDPKVCMSHLPDSFKTAQLPTESDAVASVLNQASKLKGSEKNAFLERNSQLLLGVSPSKPTKTTCEAGGGSWGDKGGCTGPIGPKK